MKLPNRSVPVSLSVIAEKVARYPHNAFLLNEFGNQLLEAGRVNEAELRYRQAVDIDPQFVMAWNNLGVARSALGKLKGAKGAYERAVRISPTYALAYYNLGVAHDAMGHYEKAVKNYERAIQLDPGLLNPRNNPQIASNRHLPAVLLQAYMDRGGSFVQPIQSAYPRPVR